MFKIIAFNPNHYLPQTLTTYSLCLNPTRPYPQCFHTIKPPRNEHFETSHESLAYLGLPSNVCLVVSVGVAKWRRLIQKLHPLSPRSCRSTSTCFWTHFNSGSFSIFLKVSEINFKSDFNLKICHFLLLTAVVCCSREIKKSREVLFANVRPWMLDVMDQLQ